MVSRRPMTAPSGRPADPRQLLGRCGERAAAQALRRAGLRIVAERARAGGVELDLVAEDGELLVFVEVKARRGTGYGTPAESVTAGKRRRLVRGALAWLARRGALDRPCRFDVVEVTATAQGLHVRHIEDAFRPEPGDAGRGRRC
jgi:putative endonuclease